MSSVDNQNAQSRTREQHRRGSAGDAGSNNDDVEAHGQLPSRVGRQLPRFVSL